MVRPLMVGIAVTCRPPALLPAPEPYRPKTVRERMEELKKEARKEVIRRAFQRNR